MNTTMSGKTSARRQRRKEDMTCHPQGRRDTLLAAVNRHAGAVDLLLVDEKVHQPFSPFWRHLAEPEADQAPRAPAGLHRDGDGFAFPALFKAWQTETFP